MTSNSGLHVIALVSGGKDSFFSALHCLENGHRLVALANLHPPRTCGNASAAAAAADDAAGDHGASAGSSDTDLNSFMYQTVGHQAVPLYADATGLPLYRMPIVGGAVRTGRDYAPAAGGGAGRPGVAAAAAAAEEEEEEEEDDETEAMVPLLAAVLGAHPEANALSAGAILSTYQRTRVESVALRLGLTPLAYLWQYPALPPPARAARDEAQLLLDMAAAGLDPRIIKVASGGLDESFLWESVASAKGVMRLKKAMGRFRSAGLDTGAVLGEGGEFETLVVDGPSSLFKKRIVVDEEDRVVIREGGGQAWLQVTRARVEDKAVGDAHGLVIRRPDLLDARFAAVLNGLKTDAEAADTALAPTSNLHHFLTLEPTAKLQTWAFTTPKTTVTLTIQDETSDLIYQIESRLAQHAFSPASIISTVIILRSMAHFPVINAVYSALFTTPNPPSRVTISCGDLLPLHTGNIAIYVTIHTGTTDRQGLHVQSRSYWAPANIGPYSQAISFPVGEGGARAVHVAGQIPLVPASMELPAGGLATQLALSLQHLWRIGTQVGVQWWTGAAVYLPRPANATSAVPAREQARLAWRAWKGAHTSSSSSSSSNDDDDDGEKASGPDLWDRRFNAQCMSYGDAGTEASLPDYGLLEDGEDRRPVPYLFAVEVDELPRAAEAEWHAHAGLSGLSSGTDTVRLYGEEAAVAAVEHCVLSSPTAGCLHSLVALRSPAGEPAAGGRAFASRVQEANAVFGASVAKLVTEGDVSCMPYLLYASTGSFTPDEISQALGGGLAVIPCASIHGGSRGEALGLVALYRRDLSSVEES